MLSEKYQDINGNREKLENRIQGQKIWVCRTEKVIRHTHTHYNLHNFFKQAACLEKPVVNERH